MLEYFKNWLTKIQNDYGVNPIIFAIIYFGCAPFFWLSIFKVITGLKNKNFNQVRWFGILLGIATIAPYIYVAAFGHNLPFWFWIFAGAIILYTFYNALLKIKKSER